MVKRASFLLTWLILVSLAPTVAHAMDSIYEINSNDHVITSANDFVPLPDSDLNAIRWIVSLGASDVDKESVFDYATTHKVIYFPSASDEKPEGSIVNNEKLSIFAIDSKKIFDRGNGTEIRNAEEFSMQRGDTNVAGGAQRCVVKIINKNANATIMRDFLNEMRILKFIGRFRGYYEDQTHRYLFNDFIPGDNLEILLRSDLTDEERTHIAVAVILAVHRLHQNKWILHNDLKSGNIKVYKKNGSYFAELVDFGQATPMNDPISDTTGSSGYRDFARLGKNRCLTCIQTDYFSLGVILFEILARKGNSYQVYILRKKVDSFTAEWDLDRDDFEQAFPDSFGLNELDDVHTLRSHLILLAKDLTGEMHFRPTPRYLTMWLAKFDIELNQSFVNADHLTEMARKCFVLRGRAPKKNPPLDTKTESKGRLRTSLKTLSLKTSSSSRSGSSMSMDSPPTSSPSLKSSSGSVSTLTSNTTSNIANNTTNNTQSTIIKSPRATMTSSSGGPLLPIDKVNKVEALVNIKEPERKTPLPQDAPLRSSKPSSTRSKKKEKDRSKGKSEKGLFHGGGGA